jgi:HEAT repeat protein
MLLGTLAAALQGAFDGDALQQRLFPPLIWTVLILLSASYVFVAYAVWLRLRGTAKRRHRRELEARWQRGILEVIAGEDAQALLESVQPKDHLIFADFLLDYARRIKGPETEIIRELARSSLPAVVPYLAHRDSYRRARGVQILGTLGMPTYADVIIRALADESDLVAMIAARSLARAGDIRHLGAVSARLSRFDMWSPRYLASLLESFGAEAAPELRRMLADGSIPPSLRRVMALALTELLDLRAADVAFDLLPIEHDADLICALLGLLTVVGRPDHLDRVRELMTSDVPSVRMHALRAVGVLGGEGDVDAVAKGVEDSSPWVALSAARALRQLGHSERLTVLAGSGHPRALLAGEVLGEGH